MRNSPGDEVEENAYIDWLHAQTASHPGVRRGIGDDAAILANGANDLVVCTDLICDGVHFDIDQCRPEQIGHKALAVNLSDIAAMAAHPVAAFASLLLPNSMEPSFVHGISSGMASLAREFDTAIAGGDTNVWEGKLVINVTVVGRLAGQHGWLRSGAQPGDELLVTGTLGGSIHGRHLDFTPRVKEALLLYSQFEVHAAMDLSDGLSMDLRRLTKASGCGAEINAASIPIADVVRQTTSNRTQQLTHAMGDGEDFELLIAMAPEEALRLVHDPPFDVPITNIGRCLESGLWLVDGSSRCPLPDIGFEHGGRK